MHALVMPQPLDQDLAPCELQGWELDLQPWSELLEHRLDAFFPNFLRSFPLTFNSSLNTLLLKEMLPAIII